MSTPTLHLLGSPEWTSEAGSVPLSRLEAAYIGFLNDHAPRRIPRETLANVFWPHSTRKRGLRSLSQLHYQTRQKLPGLPWLADSASVGIGAVATDLQSVAAAAESDNLEQVLSEARGPVLGSGHFDSEQLEQWRRRKNGQLLAAVDRVLRCIFDGSASLDQQISVAALLDTLLASSLETRSILLARIIIHLRNDERSAAVDLHTEASSTFSDIPSFDSLVNQLSAQGDTLTRSREEEQFDAFVGRSKELAVLTGVLREVKRGVGQVVVLYGEPGIGKTSLARRFMRMAATEGAITQRVQAHHATSRVPFATAVELLSSGYMATQQVEGGGSPLMPSVPEQRFDPSQFDILATTASTIEAASATAPVVICFDDAQWVDELTAQLLLFLAIRVNTKRLLLLLCVRTSEPAESVDWLNADIPFSTRLEVPPLSTEAAQQLIEQIQQQSELSLSESEKERLLRRTAGRPLLLRETLAMQAGKERNGGISVVPIAAENLLKRRFRGMPHQAVWVFGVMSAVGHPVKVSDLPQLAGLGYASIAKQVDLLLERGILEATDDELQFSHELMRHVAYMQLTVPTRILVHRRIVDHLLERDGDAAIIAQHLSGAQDPIGAAEYAIVAARLALQQGRSADAVYFYEMTLASTHYDFQHEAALALARLYFKSGKAENIRGLARYVRSEDVIRSDTLLIALADLRAVMSAGGQSVEVMLASARQISEAVSAANATQLLSLLDSLIDLALDVPERAVGEAIIQDFLSIVRATTDPEAHDEIMCASLMWELMTRGYVQPLQYANAQIARGWHTTGTALPRFAAGTILMMAGELRGAAELLEAALGIARSTQDVARQTTSMANLGIVYTELGRYDDAQRVLERSSLAFTTSHRLRSYGNLAMLAYHKGDYASAKAYAETLLASNRTHGAPIYHETASAIIGLCLFQTRKIAESAQFFNDIWSHEANDVRTSGELSFVVAFAANYLAAKGDIATALRIAEYHRNACIGIDRIAELRLAVLHADLMHRVGDERAYAFAKQVVAECEPLGAEVVAATARQVMARSRV
jgi:predicted ATPase